MPELGPLILHASAVTYRGRGVLLTGKSGSGKSSLALEMMARGATLVADDRVVLRRDHEVVNLHCPEALCGMIEARGVGILHAEYQSPSPLFLVVDLDKTEEKRFPEQKTITYLTQTVPLLHNVASQHFPAAILQYVSGEGPIDPETTTFKD